MSFILQYCVAKFDVTITAQSLRRVFHCNKIEGGQGCTNPFLTSLCCPFIKLIRITVINDSLNGLCHVCHDYISISRNVQIIAIKLKYSWVNVACNSCYI